MIRSRCVLMMIQKTSFSQHIVRNYSNKRPIHLVKTDETIMKDFYRLKQSQFKSNKSVDTTLILNQLDDLHKVYLDTEVSLQSVNTSKEDYYHHFYMKKWSSLARELVTQTITSLTRSNVFAGDFLTSIFSQDSEKLKQLIRPDELLIKEVFNNYFALKKIEDAEQLLLELDRFGSINLNVSILNLFLKNYQESGRMEECHSVLYNMVNNLNIYDIFSFNIAMKGYTRQDHNYLLVLQLFKDVQRLKLTPTISTYNYVFESLIHERSEQDALSFLHDNRNDVFPDATTVTILLQKYRNRLDLEGAKNTWNMFMNNYQLNPSPLNIQLMIDIASKCGDITYAIELLDTVSKEYKIQVQEQMLTSILHGYTKLNRMRDAENTLLQMEEKYNIEPDRMNYTILIDGYKRQNNSERRRYWETQMQDKFPQTKSSTSSVLAKAYGKKLTDTIQHS
jgi:pentatricopeptide repeat protein